ncbi:hypothetical protein HMPREF0027_0694 [Actinobacillus ureae ATCC 25976]|uniref:Uncharacterized protein n=1 Tax=Actinobacillus ureae ATCC 25976 TaxID=887324 RepID=E8KFS7_9PAST|nr:hypothetical protein HMPREF0027_0694 [Actinobacillus ureae ATCC 25976]
MSGILGIFEKLSNTNFKKSFVRRKINPFDDFLLEIRLLFQKAIKKIE